MIEIPAWLLVVFIVTVMVSIAAIVGVIWDYLEKPSQIADSLDRIDRGQDDELDLLEEIRDAVKKQ